MTDVGGKQVRPGDMLAGKYRVERVLGQGAMGVVVAAMHVDLQEMRAIKLMLPSALEAAEQQERFLREARAAARLKSLHAAKVHDFGRFEDGTPYIVMEFLEGMDLKACLDSRRTLPVTEAVTYMLQACEAIAEAHAAGIVHRDLKPANIYLAQGVGGAPCIKVLDFGIAKMSSPAGEGVGDMTKTSELLGTPLYMSPEQMRSTRAVDARTDVWALGVILYRMLTGKTPFTGTTITEVCSAVIADAPEPPRSLRADIPHGLEAVILRCLEKNASARFANAGELSSVLAAFARAEPVAATSAASSLPTETIKMQAHPSPPALGAAPRESAPSPAARPPALAYSQAVLPPSTGPSPEAAPRPAMPSQPDTPRSSMASYPETALETPMPSPPDVAVAMGQTTTRGATWTQPTQGESRRSRAGLWTLGGAAALVLVAGGVWLRSQGTDPDMVVPAASDNTEKTSAPLVAPSVAPSGSDSVVPAEPSVAPSTAPETTPPPASTESHAEAPVAAGPAGASTNLPKASPTVTKQQPSAAPSAPSVAASPVPSGPAPTGAGQRQPPKSGPTGSTADDDEFGLKSLNR